MGEPFNIPEIGSRPVELDPRTPRPAQQASRSDESQSFQEVLADTVGEVQRLQNEADDTIKQLVSGEIKDVTEAMVAVERADVSFQTMMQVRNKIVEAYQEIMRMQV